MGHHEVIIIIIIIIIIMSIDSRELECIRQKFMPLCDRHYFSHLEYCYINGLPEVFGEVN